MENREEIIREARSQMAREAVRARWDRLDGKGRKAAVAAANEARRKNAAERRRQVAVARERQREEALEREEVMARLLELVR